MERKIKKPLLASTVILAFTAQSHADHWECPILKDTASQTRPEANNPNPKMAYLYKGGSLRIKDIYKEWVFIIDEYGVYGWVPRNVLGKCQTKEGTP